MLSYINELHLGNSVYKVRPIFCDKDEIVAKTEEFVQYDMVTYLIPYNGRNYDIFRTLKDRTEKQYFLNKMLSNQILSFCKGYGLNVDKYEHTIYVQSRFKQSISMYKKIPFTSYIGEFRTNMILTDFFGVGEKVSAGFGVVKRRLNNDHYLTVI